MTWCTFPVPNIALCTHILVVDCKPFNLRQIGALLRSMGFNPTQDELQVSHRQEILVSEHHLPAGPDHAGGQDLLWLDLLPRLPGHDGQDHLHQVGQSWKTTNDTY